jgi:tetratricopeptide (TPR) repeat protein
MLRDRDTHKKFSLIVASLIALGAIAYFSLGFLQPEETSVNGYQILLDSGTDAIDIGQYDEALNYYNQALVIAREVGDRVGEGDTLTYIGFVYKAKGQHDQALEYYNQSLVIYREIGDRTREGHNLGFIGSVHLAKGQHDQSLEYFNQALVIYREVGDRAGEGNNLAYIGKMYKAKGQYNQALEYYNQALVIARELELFSLEKAVLDAINNLPKSP